MSVTFSERRPRQLGSKISSGSNIAFFYGKFYIQMALGMSYLKKI